MRASVLKRLSIVVAAAALVAGVITAFTWPGEAQQRTAQATEATAVAPIQTVAAHPNYDAGMRIIHVPDAGVIAAYPRQPHRQLNVERPAAPNAKHERIAMPKPAQPRRILPPPPANSLTPIRPTPRWRSIQKFTMPPEEKSSVPMEASPSEAVAPATIDTAAAPATAAPTETAAVPAPAEIPDIDDDSPPPAD